MENDNDINTNINIPPIDFENDPEINIESETRKMENFNSNDDYFETLVKKNNNEYKIKEQKRERQIEIENYIDEIEKKTKSCHELLEKIQITKKDIQNLKIEINICRKRLSQLEKNFDFINNGDLQNPNTCEQIKILKQKIIIDKLDKLLSEKIPELNLNPNFYNKIENEENEFHGLIHENIKVILTTYINTEDLNYQKQEEYCCFKISCNTKFSYLKKTCAIFWNINDIEEYLFTDDVEGIIYNENLIINDYMKYYSIKSNIIHLIKKNTLNNRKKLLQFQEILLEEMNSEKIKQKSENRIIKDSGNTIIRNFFKTYSGLIPYSIDKVEYKDGEEQVKTISPKELDTSLIMIILFLIVFILTLIFLYNNGYDNYLAYERIKFLNNTFDTGFINNNVTFAEYIIETLLFGLLKDRDIQNEKMQNNTFTDNIIENICKKNKINEEFHFTKLCNEENEPLSNEKISENFSGSKIPLGLYILSSLHVIVEKVKEKKCSDPLKTNISLPCYYQYYDKNSKQTKNLNFTETKNNFFINTEENISKLINDTLDNFSKFKKSKDAKIKLNFETICGNFGGSGYHFDIPLSNNYK